MTDIGVKIDVLPILLILAGAVVFLLIGVVIGVALSNKRR
jgi:hypothetical protein